MKAPWFFPRWKRRALAAEAELEREQELWGMQSRVIRALADEVPDEVRARVLAPLRDDPHLVHPVSGRRIPWHEHDWIEKPYHDGTTLRTCAIEGCPFSEVVPA